ncbi:MAG: SPOR domain-containing protein [Paramuribaculum sp.]|nr:SPOR domain-containing protein [Paramuribaculum sp.]
MFCSFFEKSVRIILLNGILISFSAAAQSPESESEQRSIVEHIMVVPGNSVVADAELLQQLKYDKDAPERSRNARVGYRVQVFSDNNPRTAKNEARSKSRMISARFPEYATYVVFASPYWRLRVGDFRSQEDAAEAAEAIKREFPGYGKEIHVVRDRINIVSE